MKPIQHDSELYIANAFKHLTSYLCLTILHTHTCVLVKRKEVWASARHCAVRHFAIISCVRVVGWYSDDGGSWSALRAQTDCVVYGVKHGPVIVNVQQCHVHDGRWAQATLRERKVGEKKCYPALMKYLRRVTELVITFPSPALFYDCLNDGNGNRYLLPS